MIDLLSPVGNFDCLKAAVQNGANSVYFGADLFSARAYASNFNLDDLEKAIIYAKARGVKTNLTLNTLVTDNEFNDAFELAKKAYEYGIDAIIVQDLGLAKQLIKHFPDLDIHASTQMTVHNLQGVLKMQELGFKRVVLSRELSLQEIEYICKNSNIEIECFVHGALCISYSGQCLFSSMVGGRSGNRGKCAQPCRLPYKLLENDEKKKGNIQQSLDINIKKFKDKAPKEVAELEKIKANKRLFKNFTVAKYATALAVPIALMGIIIPKANFMLTSYLMDRDAKKGLLPEKYLKNKKSLNIVSTEKDVESNYNKLYKGSNNPQFASLNSLKSDNKTSFTGFSPFLPFKFCF